VTPAGWFFLIGSVGGVIGLLAFCVVRIWRLR
jgi:hypothetical protein